MGDIVGGYTWKGGDVVTPSRLNSQVSDAVLTAEAIHGKPKTDTVNSADEILIWSSEEKALQRIRLESLYYKGAIVQSMRAQYSDNADISSILTIVDTIPRSDQCTQILSLSIAPVFPTSKIRIRAMGQISGPANVSAIIGIFRNDEVNAIGSCFVTSPQKGYGVNFCFEHEDDQKTNQEITYKLRIGVNGTMRLNGVDWLRIGGGTQCCSFVIEEVKA